MFLYRHISLYLLVAHAIKHILQYCSRCGYKSAVDIFVQLVGLSLPKLTAICIDKIIKLINKYVNNCNQPTKLYAEYLIRVSPSLDDGRPDNVYA